jgi:hypothetical protein
MGRSQRQRQNRRAPGKKRAKPQSPLVSCETVRSKLWASTSMVRMQGSFQNLMLVEEFEPDVTAVKGNPQLVTD